MHRADHRSTSPDSEVQVQMAGWGEEGCFLCSMSVSALVLRLTLVCCAVLQVWTKKTSSCLPAPPCPAGGALATAQQVKCKSSVVPAALRGPVSRRWYEGQLRLLSLLTLHLLVPRGCCFGRAPAVGLLCRETSQRTKSSGSAGVFSFTLFSLGQAL